MFYTQLVPQDPSKNVSPIPLVCRTQKIMSRLSITDFLRAGLGEYVWLHHGAGFLAAGAACSWSSESCAVPHYSAPYHKRFSTAQHWWDERVHHAQIISDPASAEPPEDLSSKLMAFGSFPFSATSARPSMLTIPEIIVHLSPADSGAASHVHSLEKAPIYEGLYEGWVCLIQPKHLSHPLSAAASRLYRQVLALCTAEDGSDLHANTDLYASTPLHMPSRAREEDTSQRAQFSFSPDDSCYKAAFNRVIDAIDSGNVQKVVLARRAEFYAPHQINEQDILAQLSDSYPTCWAFLYDHFLGATPEMLLNIHGGICESLVLAGTQKNTPGCSHESLKRSEKNRAEHQYALDSVLAAMKPFGHTCTSDEPFVLELPNVAHLASYVRTPLAADVGAFSILEALHPTAAVGGTPRSAAIDMINDIEMMDRERFAGPIGWVNAAGDAQWGLALRCMQLTSVHTGYLWAGGGIVAGSECEDEASEVHAKLLPLKTLLNCA